MQVNNIWDIAPVKVYEAVCPHLSATDLKMLSKVSSQWHKIITTRAALKEIQGSVVNLLENYMFFVTRKPELHHEPTYGNFVTCVRSMDFKSWKAEATRELIDTCCLDTPKLRIWKPFPPHTFTIVLGVCIKMLGSPPGDKAEVSIAYLDPSETASLIIEEKRLKLPFHFMHTWSKKGYIYSEDAYFWQGNLNESSALKIENEIKNGSNQANYVDDFIAKGHPNFQ